MNDTRRRGRAEVTNFNRRPRINHTYPGVRNGDRVRGHDGIPREPAAATAAAAMTTDLDLNRA